MSDKFLDKLKDRLDVDGFSDVVVSASLPIRLTKLVAQDEGFDGGTDRCLAHFKIEGQDKAKYFKVEIPAATAGVWGVFLGSPFRMTLTPEDK